MSEDKYKKAAENIINNAKPDSPQQGSYRQDSQNTTIKRINDGKIVENSVKVPPESPFEKKSFGLMALQSSLDELNKK